MKKFFKDSRHFLYNGRNTHSVEYCEYFDFNYKKRDLKFYFQIHLIGRAKKNAAIFMLLLEK